jgi:hypothetical protein
MLNKLFSPSLARKATDQSDPSVLLDKLRVILDANFSFALQVPAGAEASVTSIIKSVEDEEGRFHYPEIPCIQVCLPNQFKFQILRGNLVIDSEYAAIVEWGQAYGDHINFKVVESTLDYLIYQAVEVPSCLPYHAVLMKWDVGSSHLHVISEAVQYDQHGQSISLSLFDCKAIVQIMQSLQLLETSSVQLV